MTAAAAALKTASVIRASPDLSVRSTMLLLLHLRFMSDMLEMPEDEMLQLVQPRLHESQRLTNNWQSQPVSPSAAAADAHRHGTRQL